MTPEDASNMEDLIVSLSLESTDERRRERLKSLFEEELAKTESRAHEFAESFAKALNTVGDQIQSVAREKAIQRQREAGKNDEQLTEGLGNTSERETSEEERQLWAMVDMMVQSKVLFKTAFGEMGSKGSFQ